MKNIEYILIGVQNKKLLKISSLAFYFKVIVLILKEILSLILTL